MKSGVQPFGTSLRSVKQLITQSVSVLPTSQDMLDNIRGGLKAYALFNELFYVNITAATSSFKSRPELNRTNGYNWELGLGTANFNQSVYGDTDGAPSLNQSAYLTVSDDVFVKFSLKPIYDWIMSDEQLDFRKYMNGVTANGDFMNHIQFRVRITANIPNHVTDGILAKTDYVFDFNPTFVYPDNTQSMFAQPVQIHHTRENQNIAAVFTITSNPVVVSSDSYIFFKLNIKQSPSTKSSDSYSFAFEKTNQAIKASVELIYIQ